jgi:hypothetical protein
MVVLGVLAIMVGLSVPSLRSAGRRGELVLAGHQMVAGAVAAREAALALGRCVAVGADTVQGALVAAPFPTADCEVAVGSMVGGSFDIGGTTVAPDPRFTVPLERDTGLMLSFAGVTNAPATHVMVFRPTGWLRAENTGLAGAVDVSDNATWRMNVQSMRLGPLERTVQVAVTAVGLTCVTARQDPTGESPCP